MLPSVIRSGAILTAGNMVAGLLSYGFIIMAARGLGPDEFGSLGVLLTFLYFASSLVQGIATLVSRYAAALDKEDGAAVPGLVRSSTFTVGAYAIGGLVVYAAISPLLNSVLNIDNLTAVMIIGFICVLRAVAGVFRGALEGLHRFAVVAAAMTVEAASRFALGLMFISIGFTLLRTVSAFVVGAIFLTGIEALMLPVDWRRLASSKPCRSDFTVTLNAYVIGGSFLLIAMLTQLDMIAAKYFLTADVAGYYAAASNLLRAPFVMVAGGFASAMFPSVVRAGAYTRHGLKLLAVTSATIVGGTGAIVLVCFLVPELIVGALLGAEFLPLAAWLAVFAAGSSAPALLLIVARYHMARRPAVLILSLSAGLLAAIVSLALLHDSHLHMILATVVGSVVPLIPLSIIAARITPADEPMPDEDTVPQR